MTTTKIAISVRDVIVGALALIPAIMVFAYLQSDVAVAQQDIKDLTANASAIQGIQNKQEVDSARFDEILKKLDENAKRIEISQQANSRLLQQISSQLK